MAEFEFISASDKPALIAIGNPEWQAAAQSMLLELGYKVHLALDPADFTNRFSGVQYQVILIEELFCAATPAENSTLQELQRLPMNLRRHATIILIGESFQTLHTMQAYQQSVHAVVNPAELLTLGQIILKTVAENDLFLHTFRDTQKRMSEGKA